MKKVLITAGASGLGKAMATAFDVVGDAVWIVDLDQKALDGCPDHWQKTMLDVTDEKAVAALFNELKRQWGSLDVLCSNAGIAGPTAKLEEIPLDEWQRCVSVNLEGAGSKPAHPFFLFEKYFISHFFARFYLCYK